MCSIKAFYQATSWQEVQQKLVLMQKLIHIAHSNYLFAKILYLSSSFDAGVEVLLSAVYSTHMKSFLYTIYTFFFGLAIYPLLHVHVANHAVSLGFYCLTCAFFSLMAV